MKSLEEKFAWLKSASAEERRLAINVLKQQVTIHQDGFLVVIVDETSLPLDKEFVKVLNKHFPHESATSKLAKNSIAQKIKQRVVSQRRRKSKDVKSTSVELTKEASDCLQWLRKACKASQNLVVDSLLKDEFDYTLRLKSEIKSLKHEQRQLRAENRDLISKVKNLEIENQDFKRQLESLGKQQRDAYQQEPFDNEGDNDFDDSNVSSKEDESQRHEAQVDGVSANSDIEGDAPGMVEKDLSLDDSEDAAKEVKPADSLTAAQRGARFMTKNSRAQDSDIPARENTRMRAIYDSEEDNKKLNFND